MEGERWVTGAKGDRNRRGGGDYVDGQGYFFFSLSFQRLRMELQLRSVLSSIISPTFLRHLAPLHTSVLRHYAKSDKFTA